MKKIGTKIFSMILVLFAIILINAGMTYSSLQIIKNQGTKISDIYATGDGNFEYGESD